MLSHNPFSHLLEIVGGLERAARRLIVLFGNGGSRERAPIFEQIVGPRRSLFGGIAGLKLRDTRTGTSR